MKRGVPILLATAVCTTAFGWLCLTPRTLSAATKMYLGDYYHPKLKAGEATIRRIIVLPPVLELTKNTMKGAQSMEKEGEKVSPILDRAIIRSLKEAGVTVSEASPTDAMLLASPELRETMNNVQRSFDAVAPVMLGRLKDVKKGRFKLGPEVSETKWNEAEHSDTLLFIKGFGGQETKSKAFATGGGLLGAIFAGGLNINMVMTFVDANSGDVLLVKCFFVAVKDDDTEDKLVHSFDKWLKPNIKKGTFGAS